MAGDVLGGGGFSGSALNSRKLKEPVRVVATSNIDLTGPETIDGVTVEDGDRVLATAQTTTTQNRAYVVSTSGAWTAAADTDTDAEAAGAVLQVLEGTLHAGDLYWQSTALADLVFDPQVWVAINPGVTAAVKNAANTYTVGTQTFPRDTADTRGVTIGGALLDPVVGSGGITLAGADGSNPYIIAGVSATRWALFAWDDGESLLKVSTSTNALGMLVQSNGGPLVLGTGTSAIGFFGSAGGTKPTVTGSRATGAATASLLTALAALGLVIDNSTA